MLVAYRWFVEQAVAATNTLTHAILGFPVVANGLRGSSACCSAARCSLGAGGVFGAFLVIVGVLFAAGLFASQVAAHGRAGAADRRGAAADRAVGRSPSSRIWRVPGRTR